MKSKLTIVEKIAHGMKAHVAVLVALMCGMFVQGLLFVVGVSCSAWPMLLSFGALALVMAVYNRRCLLRFVALTFVLWLLTAYTFSYTGTDALSCHFPMQDLLRRGWNPLYVATVDSFSDVVENLSLAKYHILFMPKAAALCGALVASATGLFAADTFLQYAMLVVLMFESFDFGRRYFMLTRLFSCFFSFAIVSTTKLTSILAGQIDGLVYLEIIAMILAAVLYMREKRVSDLLLFSLALAFSLLTKPNAMAVGLVAWVCLLLFLRKDGRFIVASCFVLLVFAVIGASPYITSAIHYSSPFYPAHTFSSAHPVIDITSDFTCNADGALMGRFSRCTYAWISSTMTKKICSVIYGIPNFNPVFYVCGGVGGFGAFFRFLIFLSFVALVFAKKNEVTLVCLFLFAMSIATPIKYIGYGRYFPFVWAIPILALFNFTVNPLVAPKNRLVWRLLSISIISIPLALASVAFVRTLAYYGRSVAIESYRQKMHFALSRKSAEWSIKGDGKNSYALVRRMAAAGINCRVNDIDESNGPILLYDWQTLWVSDTKEGMEFGENIANEFYIANTLKDLVEFPWRKAYGELLSASILWADGGQRCPVCL